MSSHGESADQPRPSRPRRLTVLLALSGVALAAAAAVAAVALGDEDAQPSAPPAPASTTTTTGSGLTTVPDAALEITVVSRGSTGTEAGEIWVGAERVGEFIAG
ncbi:MAG: hypothetical protein OEW85_09270, partial [Acidimicrobiia bacterium]|nr:hypothetical protein [Acidimicrobiia bacterium]